MDVYLVVGTYGSIYEGYEHVAYAGVDKSAASVAANAVFDDGDDDLVVVEMQLWRNGKLVVSERRWDKEGPGKLYFEEEEEG